MQNNLNNFYQTIEKKYLPNGQKDIFVGTTSLYNILNKQVDMKTCESIFLKSLSILALNNGLTVEKLKEHLTASKSIEHFNESQIVHFNTFLLAVNKLAQDGKGVSSAINIESQGNKAVGLSSYLAGILIFGSLVIIPVVVNNLLQYYGSFISKSTLILWLGFLVIPTLWLLNNIIFGLLSLLARKYKVSSVVQLLFGVFSIGIALNAMYFSLTTYEPFSVRSVMNLITAGFVLHASTIFIKQRNTPIK